MFIGRTTLESLPSLTDISEVINTVVDEVKGQESVILCYCFSNRDKRRRGRNSGLSLLVFPKYGKIEYSLKKESFWVNQGDDPIMVHSVYLTKKEKVFPAELLLFGKNAFENKQEYSHVNVYTWLQRPYVFQKEVFGKR